MIGLLTKNLADLSEDDIAKLLGMANINITVTPALKAAAIAMLKDADINTVAGLIQDGESLRQLASFAQNQSTVAAIKEEKQIVQCPHCTFCFFT